MDGDGSSNNVHYSSKKSRRVTKSVLAAELFAMTHRFDVASTILLFMNDISGKIIWMKFYTDSWSLFDCLTNICSTSEKRLHIDLRMLRESYERHETTEMFWIPGSRNPDDAFKKLKTFIAFRHFMENDSVRLTPNAWAKRNTTSTSLDWVEFVCEKKKIECRIHVWKSL